MLWSKRRVVRDDGKHDHTHGHKDKDQIQAHHHLQKQQVQWYQLCNTRKSEFFPKFHFQNAKNQSIFQ
jgi:hypothetical protein